VAAIQLVPNAPRIAEIYFTYAMALAKVGRCGETLQIAQTVQGTIPTDDIAVGNVNQAIQTCQQNLGSSSSHLTSFPAIADSDSYALNPKAHTREACPLRPRHESLPSASNF